METNKLLVLAEYGHPNMPEYFKMEHTIEKHFGSQLDFIDEIVWLSNYWPLKDKLEKFKNDFSNFSYVVLFGSLDDDFRKETILANKILTENGITVYQNFPQLKKAHEKMNGYGK